METWGLPLQRAPALVSGPHRHSGDKKVSHDGSPLWIWDGDSMGGDRVTGEKQRSPLGYDTVTMERMGSQRLEGSKNFL